MSMDAFIYRNLTPPPDAGNTPLSGKRFTVQANMSVRDWPTEAGSVALKGYIAVEDSTVVSRLQKAGACLVGSTRMSELGFGIRNDSSAKAVVDGHADIALITDTMGEARMAAALAGVCGFKPSHGIVSRFGLFCLVPSMECIGIAARHPFDITAVLGAIAGYDENDYSMAVDGIPDPERVHGNNDYQGFAGFIREFLESLGEEENGIFRESLQWLEMNGWRVREVSLPDIALLPAVHNVIGSVEASSSGGKYDGVRYGYRAQGTKNWNEMYLKTREEAFGLLVKSYLMQGAYFQFENYRAFENACRIRNRLLRKTQQLLQEVAMLVFPTRRHAFPADMARNIKETYEAFPFTMLSNVTGQPAIHLSNTHGGNPLEPGVQLVGPLYGDFRLLGMAERLFVSRKGAD